MKGENSCHFLHVESVKTGWPDRKRSVLKMHWIRFSWMKIAHVKLMTDDGWQPDSDEIGGGGGGEICRGKGQQC